MRVIDGDGVNDLYANGVQMLANDGVLEQTRNGPAYVMPCPVTSVYRRPTHRVLLNRKRNANPFFHLYESLWMLAGRNDVASLNNYIGNFGQRFAENNGLVHGAYGHRWRQAMGFDQIEVIVERLRKNPQDRQCVLQMWDGVESRSNDLTGEWLDRPCNTHIYFRVRNEVETVGANITYGIGGSHQEKVSCLDMTICCRSNDIVYGAYGANAVHFSVLMEYIAGRLGVEIGTMYQISNNYHGYVDTMPSVSDAVDNRHYDSVNSIQMGNDWERWDEDLSIFMQWQSKMLSVGGWAPDVKYANQWFNDVAEPMFMAHQLWRSDMKSQARLMVDKIAAPDWRMACQHWFDTRSK